MAIAKMLKLSLFGYSGIKNKVIDDIHKAGIIEISEIEKKDVEKVFPEDESKKNHIAVEERLQEILKIRDDLSFALKFLQPYKPKKSLMASFSSDNLVFDDDTYLKIAREFKYNNIEKIKRFANRISELHSTKHNYKSRIEYLKPWEGMRIDINDLESASKKVQIIFCIIEEKNFSLIKNEIQKVKLAELNVVHSTKENQYCAIILEQDEMNSIQDIIKKHNISLVDFTDIHENVSHTIKEYQSKINEIDEELKDIQQELKEFVYDYDKMMVCLDYWSNVYEKERVKAKFLHTDSAFLIKGWLKNSDVSNLDKIKEKYKEIDIILEKPVKKDNPPVALENKAFNSPFEMVTKLFGLPTKKETDPTPLFAPFFALFFGICLTDAGYGLALMIIALLMLRNKYLGPGAKKLLRLSAISGLLTIIVGVLAGGFFGIQFETLPASLQAVRVVKEKIAILDPLKNPLLLFGVAIGLGVFQLTLGFIIKFIMGLRNKEYREALVEALPWVLITPSFSLLLMDFLFKITVINNTISTVLFCTGAGIILFFKSSSKNPLARLGAGIYGLYDITGVFGDIVSYSRLFALALATGVVAMVINIILGIAFGIVGKVPIFLMPFIVLILVVVLVFAHLFNLGINALGAFVHTTRLQFVEYFTKFYASGGREFQPFEEKLEYVHIERD